MAQSKWQRLAHWLVAEDLGILSVKEPMAHHTSWKIGGPAELMCWPKNLKACSLILAQCSLWQVPVKILGSGTNLLVADQGVAALVINTREMKTIFWEENQVMAQAGVPLALLAGQAARKGLQGLAFAIGIPGSVGGAVLMNAGAYGSAMEDVLEKVLVLDDQGEEKVLTCKELNYGYRRSLLKEKGWLTGAAWFKLQLGDRQQIEQQMNEYLLSRKAKQPLDLPNGGSVFKNPQAQGAGGLIDSLGLKGLRIGDAQVSVKHANFIVNLGQATARDTVALIKTVQQQVLLQQGVSLETEVIYWGFD